LAGLSSKLAYVQITRLHLLISKKVIWLIGSIGETAEVQLVDGFTACSHYHCAKEEGFITDRTALVDAVFRLFLANGNDPNDSQRSLGNAWADLRLSF
jgi:hypothetical protein